MPDCGATSFEPVAPTPWPSNFNSIGPCSSKCESFGRRRVGVQGEGDFEDKSVEGCEERKVTAIDSYYHYGERGCKTAEHDNIS